MSNDLALPQVPEPKPEDPEDVSWALSTADAMWARGDHAEGIKWVRRAAEAASEAENDARALELAKAAADLAGVIKRMTRASFEIEELVPLSEPPPLPSGRPSAAPRPPAPKVGPSTAPKAGPSTGPKASPSSVTRQVITPSRPPAPLPSSISRPPTSDARPSQPPAAEPRASQAPARLSSKPLGTNTKPSSLRPGALKPDAGDAPKDAASGPASKRPPRRGRESVTPEAPSDPPRVRGSDAGSHPALSADTLEVPASMQAAVAASRRDASDLTVVGSPADIRARARSELEWDPDLTQSLGGEEFPDAERKTTPNTSLTSDLKPRLDSAAADARAPGAAPPPPGAAPPPAAGPASGAVASVQPGASAKTTSGTRPSQARHDPGITTSQAVRVVVWRDGSGVHVAPAGTVVSAITVDAVLVALEPSADLTAWLTQKGR
jgi:hypothetical protein